MRDSATPSQAYLDVRLRVLVERVRNVVMLRRQSDSDPDDPYRGLYVSDAHLDDLLAGRGPSLVEAPEDGRVLEHLEQEAVALEEKGSSIGLRRLGSWFQLEPIELELLLVCVAPDLDPRFEQLYGYLNDDVTRRRATIGLALELTGCSLLSSTDRGRFAPGSKLIGEGLVTVEDLDRPFLGRSLRTPDRVTHYLLGDDRQDPLLSRFKSEYVDCDVGNTERLSSAISRGLRLFYVRGRDEGTARSFAASALSKSALSAISIDFSLLEEGDESARVATLVRREARLSHAGVVAGPVEESLPATIHALRRLADIECPLVLFGPAPWDPRWLRKTPVLVDLPKTDMQERLRLWQRELDLDLAADGHLATSINHHHLQPDQIVRAAETARTRAEYEGRQIQPDDLRLGVMAQNASGLTRMARRVEPSVSWNDLVLSDQTLHQLRELETRVRHRDLVLNDWGLKGSAAKGTAVTSLFAGPSGTGKTISAEALAGALGVDLYTIDLSAIVDKYIGETEKNLNRVFEEAEGLNAVLFFDEAEALFGKRTEVRDSHDRYANIEIAYLLQRMEGFDGIAILATNLRSSLDEAFTRRLDSVIDFEMPDAGQRLRLWEKHLGTRAPRSADLDLNFCADSFELTGGDIRNIVLTAAYAAAHERAMISMHHLMTATGREFRKLGRLCLEADFGPHYALISS
ncbi:MAG: ATP-binding protein [Actinomycetota bacterium]|nr:ATP-binding protein [Actinomycetota bacterium]